MRFQREKKISSLRKKASVAFLIFLPQCEDLSGGIQAVHKLEVRSSKIEIS